jgi:hypothetical protein
MPIPFSHSVHVLKIAASMFGGHSSAILAKRCGPVIGDAEEDRACRDG